MKKWNMIIDVARCHDCNDCFLADKDEFVANDFPPYSAAQPRHGHRWMNIRRKERGQFPLVETAYLPMPCMHCDDAPCLTDDGAVYKRDDGLVIIDPVRARGRKEIVSSCPYSAIYWNDEEELAQKCTGCAHLLDDGWTETRCSQVCPTEAIRFVMAEDDEFERRVEEEGLQRYRDSLGTRPRVWYKNLYLWETAFVGVSIVFGDNDECGEGATVAVSRQGATAREGIADLFGEVRVDRLEPGHDYVVRVQADGYEPAEVEVHVDHSVYAGVVVLEKI